MVVGVARGGAGDAQVLRVLVLQHVERVVYGHDAQQALVVVHDGKRHQVVLCYVLRHVLLVLVRTRGDEVVVDRDGGKPVRGVRDCERLQRYDAGKAALIIRQVDVIDGLEVVLQVAELLDGVRRGRVLRKRHHLGRHDAARGVLAVSQQLANGLLLLHAHQAQQLLGLVVVQLAHELRRVVRVHLGQHARRVRLLHVAHDLGGHGVVVELGHRLAGLLVVQLCKHLAAQARVKPLQDVRDVRGVHVVQRLVRDGQLHVGKVPVQQVHVVPRDDLLGDGLSQRARYLQHHELEPGRQRAQQPADAHLRAQQAQLRRARVAQLQVVHAHDAQAARVDDLLVQEVSRHEDLVRLQVREPDVGRDHLQLHLVVVERVDVLAPADHERRLAGALHGKRRHARKHLARGDAKVVDLADLLAAEVVNGISQHLGQIDHACSLVGMQRAGSAARRLQNHPPALPTGHARGSSTVRSRFHQ